MGKVWINLKSDRTSGGLAQPPDIPGSGSQRGSQNGRYCYQGRQRQNVGNGCRRNEVHRWENRILAGRRVLLRLTGARHRMRVGVVAVMMAGTGGGSGVGRGVLSASGCLRSNWDRRRAGIAHCLGFGMSS